MCYTTKAQHRLAMLGKYFVCVLVFNSLKLLRLGCTLRAHTV